MVQIGQTGTSFATGVVLAEDLEEGLDRLLDVYIPEFRFFEHELPDKPYHVFAMLGIHTIDRSLFNLMSLLLSLIAFFPLNEPPNPVADPFIAPIRVLEIEEDFVHDDTELIGIREFHRVTRQDLHRGVHHRLDLLELKVGLDIDLWQLIVSFVLGGHSQGDRHINEIIADLLGIAEMDDLATFFDRDMVH